MSDLIRVLVTGARNYQNKHQVKRGLTEALLWKAKQFKPGHPNGSAWVKLIVVEGCARGADNLAEQICQETGWENEHHPADWNELGKAAGVIRNQEMLDSGIHLCLAFHRDLRESRGTADMVQRCLRAKIPVWLYG